MKLTRFEDHPSDEQLVAWLDTPGDLSPARAAMLGGHVEHCPVCQARLEALAEVEVSLQALKALEPPIPEHFKAQVMAALPADLYGAAPTRRGGFRTWLSEQVAAVAFMLAGVAAFILSGDALVAAAQWWADAQAWLGNAAAYDSAWVNSSPAGALESHLGLLPGAMLLGIGAFLLLVTNLRPAVQMRPPNRLGQAVSIHS